MRPAENTFYTEEYFLVVFLFHQAVEKGLKAYFLEVKKTSPGTTHSLVYLASETNVPRRFFRFLRRLTTEFETIISQARTSPTGIVIQAKNKTSSRNRSYLNPSFS